MNTVRQIAPKYFLVHNPDDEVAGVIVWLENGCYSPYVDGLAPVAFANRDAVIEYVGILEAELVEAQLVEAELVEAELVAATPIAS